MQGKIHHWGYAVANIHQGIAAFVALGWTHDGIITEDTMRQVTLAFLQRDGQRVELVAPRAPESPVARYLHHGLGSPYHVCYEVTDWEVTKKELMHNGFALIRRPAVAPALDGDTVSFWVHPVMGVFEILVRA